MEDPGFIEAVLPAVVAGCLALGMKLLIQIGVHFYQEWRWCNAYSCF